MKAQELDFDWSALTKWANWIAMDESGDWWWYREMPHLDEDGYPVWDWQPGNYGDKIPEEYAPKNYKGDWRGSLFKVPKHEVNLPEKVKRIIALAAVELGTDYPGSTVGIIGRKAVEICEEYGIDPSDYFISEESKTQPK